MHLILSNTYVNIAALFAGILLLPSAQAATFISEPVPKEISEPDKNALWTVPVVVIRYIPRSADGTLLDPAKAPDFHEAGKVAYEDKKKELDAALLKTRYYRQEGTRFRAYRNPSSTPSITYPVVAIYTVEDLPPASDKFYLKNKNGDKVPFPDWFQIMKEINGKKWVEQMKVKEFWVWSTDYHGTEPSNDSKTIPKTSYRAGAESNMSSKSGDISNSSRLEDLPVYKHSYTVYQYNLHRSVNENIHNHIHQLEDLLNHVDRRDQKPQDKWNELLFWGKFVGADSNLKLTEPRRCGWGHFPPNADNEYEYESDKTAMSDIEDWTPDGSGQFKPINTDRWNKVEAEWHLLWMQSLPGKDNNLKYKNHSLSNWWVFVADWDEAVQKKYKLTK
jgi:hypothetical protein